MRYVIRTTILVTLAAAVTSTGCLKMSAKENQNAKQWSAGALGVNAPIRRRAFSDNHAYNQDISGRPVSANSLNYLAACGVAQLQADFGPPLNGNPNGLAYMAVDAGQVPVAINFFDAANSDAGPYPVPADAQIEDGSSSTGDRRVIVVDRQNGKLYEMSSSYPDGAGGWNANAGAIFDLYFGAQRPDGKHAATASGLPLFPALVRADEVLDVGDINHALAFTCPNTASSHIPPATSDNGIAGAFLPPMGLRVRLKSDFEIPGAMPRTAQIILQALKKYGMILVDNGPSFRLKGTADARWSSDELSTLNAVLGSDGVTSDFEVVE